MLNRMLIAVVFVMLLSISACSSEAQTDTDALRMSDTVNLSLSIEVCVCREYDKFDLSWPAEDSALVCVPALINTLISADLDSLLLCDCSHGKGDKYANVIDSVQSHPDGLGITVYLSEKIWLDELDVRPSMREFLVENRRAIFTGRSFDIW